MKNEKLMRILSYVVVALLAVVVTMGIMLGIFLSNRQNGAKLMALEQLILDCFIGDADQVAMEDAAADAMVKSLGDQWSYYIPSASYQAYLEQMRNAYVGVGITIERGQDEALPRVQAVTADGPAEDAGMQAGDIIAKVDGSDITNMDLTAIKQLVQGKAGTEVALTIQRGHRELVLHVTRREIKSPVATAQMLENKTGLVTIKNFNSNCATETIGAIELLRAQGVQKLIFDVRNNPGGYAEELVKVLDYLLPEGKLFTRVDYSGKEYTDYSDSNCVQLPMAVLVNGNSYSAAEFFAAALAEYDAAEVVGEKTTGKGYFQSTFELPDGSAVGLSIGKYFTPKGVSLAQVGVTPDIPLSVDAQTAEKIQSGAIKPMEDPQILAAIQGLN